MLSVINPSVMTAILSCSSQCKAPTASAGEFQPLSVSCGPLARLVTVTRLLCWLSNYARVDQALCDLIMMESSDQCRSMLTSLFMNTAFIAASLFIYELFFIDKPFTHLQDKAS